MRRPTLAILAALALAIAALSSCSTDEHYAGRIRRPLTLARGAAPPADWAGGPGDDLGVTPIAADELWIVARGEGDGGGEVTEAEPESPALRAVLPDRDEEVPLPLEHTAVHARIHAYIASVEVEQQYRNPYSEKIEVVYVFPLPQDAAVSEFVMKIGDRVIRGIIREREEAERIYAEARSQGYVASLLTQERPNVFTQKVANIEPGRDIGVELTYYNTLPFRDGAYVFTFPTVVGPRFNPPGHRDGIGAVGHGDRGASGQSTEVEYLKPGQRSGHDLSLEIDLEAGVAIEAVSSPSHDIEVESTSASRRLISLAEGAMIPDRDFVLRYEVAGEQIQSAFLLHEDARGGYFTFVLTPPSDLGRFERAPLEHVFVLDCSGSMSGSPLRTAKQAVERVIDQLDERDTFQIIRFSSDSSALGPAPIRATERNKREGLAYLRGLSSGGGTMMIEGIKAALDFPHEEGRVRIVSFMTDGYIGNEAEILAAIHRRLGRSRIFSFGVGSAPNRYLLEQMARIGQGAVAYVGEGDRRDDREAVDAFYDRIAHPALSDIEVDWGAMQVSEVYPSRIPDLWSGRPVVVTGRIHGPAGGGIEVRGRTGGERRVFRAPVHTGAGGKRPAIAQVWARMKIMDLADRSLWSDDRAELADGIRSLALEYGLLSRFTAFVAVDSSQRTAGEVGYTVSQPVPVPHGVRYDTTVTEK